MINKRIAQTNQQQKSETSQASGILQRTAVRSVADAGVQFEEQEAQPYSKSAFSKDFSRVPISTTQPQPIQAKLMIGEPGDKYEQEADRVASQVVQQINTPSAAHSDKGKSVQRQDAAEEEIQTKPSISVLQRSPIPTKVQLEAMPEDEELQAKSILQGRDARGSGEASTDVESAINSARGGGQPLDAGLQQSMGQAMGADFSGVKVHTDAQSDQLNRSIQAKAFTTGQDVFFRQGAYEPWSRGGQELLAHELTHVAQQNGGAVQRWPLPPQQLLQHPAIETPSALVGKGVLQKADVNPTTFFTGARADTAVDADINANNKMSGFGTQVNGADWHTQLTFGPLSSAQAGPNGMKPEGTSVIGVIGPDHPYGSQPKSETAKTNNGIAAKLRKGTPHVAAHIVNDQLGGPGITQNLFAFPSTANTAMEKQVEKRMKKAVTDGNYIYYQANVNHPTNNEPADFITMSWNKLDHMGKDIGGGQTNVKIYARNIKENTEIVGLENNKVAAQNKNLIQPRDGTYIKGQPWGPFQMPDPKNTSDSSTFLDSTVFPAVGNEKAFKGFFTEHSKHNDKITKMFNELTSSSDIVHDLGVELTNSSEADMRRVASPNPKKRKADDQGAGRTRRGMTSEQLDKLKNKDNVDEQKKAFIKIIQGHEKNKVIEIAARLFSDSARLTARTRIDTQLIKP